MGFSLRKTVLLSAYTALLLICSCDKHPVGQMPEVQREKGATAEHETDSAAPAAHSPAGSPTPAEFFPASKP